jgi:sensor histidine kinase YesM
MTSSPHDRPDALSTGTPVPREYTMALAFLGLLATLHALLHFSRVVFLPTTTSPDFALWIQRRAVDALLIPWSIWAIMALPLQWVGRRVGHERAPGLLVAAAFALLALAAGTVYTVVYSWLSATSPPEIHPFLVELRFFFEIPGLYLLQISIALALLGIGYAVRVRDRAAREELASARLQSGLYREQLRGLQRRLTPHFLMNALNSVTGLVQTHRSDEAVRLIARIGRFLVRSLDDGLGTEIPLEEELQLADEYRALGAARLDDEIRYDVEVETGLEGALVPPFVLQPLLENAMEHGHSPNGVDALRIRVRATREGDARLLLAVEDSGRGWSDPHEEGHGLRLTRESLELRYGTGAELRRGLSRELGGSRVEIVFPLEHGADGAAGEERV